MVYYTCSKNDIFLRTMQYSNTGRDLNREIILGERKKKARASTSSSTIKRAFKELLSNSDSLGRFPILTTKLLGY